MSRQPRELPTVPLHEFSSWRPERFATRFFPVTVDLRVRRDVTLPAHHAALVCGLLKRACALGSTQEQSFPDGVLLDAPEQARLVLQKGETYRFGVTLVASSEAAARERLTRLIEGVRRLGRNGPAAAYGLHGNFEVADVVTLPDGHPAERRLAPIPDEVLRDEVEFVRQRREVTLRFRSPLHCERPKTLRQPRADCFDGQVFPPDVFLRRAARRLQELEILTAIPDVQPQHVEVVTNRLVWLDVEYGDPKQRKPLSGAVGRITLRLNEPDLAEILVLAQYARVGEKTRFGFGAFRIEELGESPFVAKRSVGLWELALKALDVEQLAEEHELEVGRVTTLLQSCRDGQYAPSSAQRILLSKGDADDEPRLLCVPRDEDRMLQSCVLRRIAPALDQFFEQSSFAYRRGLGRQSAAKRIQAAYRAGFHWAVRSDFHRFFDSVRHELLRDRLEAYLADDELARWIMRWVETSSPWPGRGLPTGSPLSPLLSNLFLDRFDEAIEEAGARLVRYADDFLILFRDPRDAQRLFDTATELARHVKLHLNQNKTQFLDLRQPFEFLGYRFERKQDWEVVDGQPPRHIDDLGWADAPKLAPPPPELPRLPGESELNVSNPAPVVIAGPGVEWLGVDRQQVVLRYRDRRPETRWPTQRLEDLIVLGLPTIDASWLRHRGDRPVRVWLADDAGRLDSVLFDDDPADNALLIVEQVRAASDPARALPIARSLVAAKLSNYAALAAATPSRSPRGGITWELLELARRAESAADAAELLGLEGAGAALWYRALEGRLHPKFQFPKRVAPGADDPVNALLNLGFTWLYRLAYLLAQREGLAPSVGFLHQPRSGHAALASDVMEPFRHLIDRTVIAATYRLKPQDFQPDKNGPFPLRIVHGASKTFIALLHSTLTTHCVGVGQTEPRPYRQQLAAVIRSLHRHLVNPNAPFQVFRHSP